MKPLKLSFVAAATGGTLVGPDLCIFGVSADSRTVAAGSLFVALPGSRTDGHSFIDQALARGAVAVMVTAPGSYPCPYILVDDAPTGLYNLAKSYLSRSQAKVIAVTGSMGKTSTKEMVAAAIGSQVTVYRSPGNLNTDIGLPLSVLEHENEEVMVLEMAMRGLGQIAYLAELAPPDIAIVTNVGESHLEVLGSRENIARAKGELLTGMKTGGIAVLNRDDDYYHYLAGLVQGPVVSFGRHSDADFCILSYQLGSNGKYSAVVATGAERFAVSVPWYGKHNVYNAAAALAAASAAGVELEKALVGLRECPVGDRRLNIFTLDGAVIIDDTYNSNPASCKAALETLQELGVEGRCVAVLGNMLELGQRSTEGHIEVGLVAARVCDLVITIGELAELIADTAAEQGAKVIRCKSKPQVVELLLEEIRAGDAVLIKGSRGMQLEDIVAELCARRQ